MGQRPHPPDPAGSRIPPLPIPAPSARGAVTMQFFALRHHAGLGSARRRAGPRGDNTGPMALSPLWATCPQTPCHPSVGHGVGAASCHLHPAWLKSVGAPLMGFLQPYEAADTTMGGHRVLAPPGELQPPVGMGVACVSPRSPPPLPNECLGRRTPRQGAQRGVWGWGQKGAEQRGRAAAPTPQDPPTMWRPPWCCPQGQRWWHLVLAVPSVTTAVHSGAE